MTLISIFVVVAFFNLWQALEVEEEAFVVDLVELQRHLDQMFRNRTSPPDVNVIRIDDFPFLKNDWNISFHAEMLTG